MDALKKYNKYLYKLSTISTDSPKYSIYNSKVKYYKNMMGGCDLKILESYGTVPCAEKQCEIVGKGSYGTVLRDADSDCILKITKKMPPVDPEINSVLKDCEIGHELKILNDENNTTHIYKNYGNKFSHYFENMEKIMEKIMNTKIFLNNINLFIQIITQLQCVYNTNIAYYDLKRDNIVYSKTELRDNKYEIYDDSTVVDHIKVTIIDIDGFVKLNDNNHAPLHETFGTLDEQNLPIEFYTGAMSSALNSKRVLAPLLTGFINIILFVFKKNIIITDFYIKDKYGLEEDKPEDIHYTLDFKKLIDFVNAFIPEKYKFYKDDMTEILTTCLLYPSEQSLDKILQHLNNMKKKYLESN